MEHDISDETFEAIASPGAEPGKNFDRHGGKIYADSVNG